MAGRGTDIVLGGSLQAELAALGADATDAQKDNVKADWKTRPIFISSLRRSMRLRRACQAVGSLRNIKHGITLDSGSAVDITPASENAEFDTVPLSGPRKGRRLGAANGTPIEIAGEKWIAFTTREGWNLVWPFIAGNVKKTLKSVGTTCDANNYVIFYKTHGFNVHEPDNASIELWPCGKRVRHRCVGEDRF